MKNENLPSNTPLGEAEINNASTPISGKDSKVKFSLRAKWKEIMNAIKEKTGIDGIYVIIVLSLCVSLVYLGIFESLITSLVGTLYPGFSTIKAIQKNKNKKDWLTYWIIFGCFLIFDSCSGIILGIFRFYFVAKILFLIWMFLPGSNGCKLVYDFLITKVMTPLEILFDKFFEGVNQAKKEILEETAKKTKNIIKFTKNIKRGPNNINSNNSLSVLEKPVDKGNLIPEIKKEEQKLKQLEEHIKFQKELEEFQKSKEEASKEDENQNIMMSNIVFNNESDDEGKNDKKKEEEGETKFENNLNKNE